MIQGIFQSTSLPALEQAAKFSERRHEVLAGNVANISTPGYRARDLSVKDFEQSLAIAIDQQLHGPESKAASLRGSTETVDPFEATRSSMSTLVHHDDSDISLEHQATELAKNKHLHDMALAIMRSQFGTLNAAISERV